MDLKDLSDLELMKLHWEAQEKRDGWAIDRIKKEMSRRTREE